MLRCMFHQQHQWKGGDLMKRSLMIYVTTPDPKFKWAYIVTRFQDSYVHKSLQKFRCIMRCGVPQSDWVNGRTWGSPIRAMAPPQNRGV